MHEILIMLVLCFFTACGVFMTMAACINGGTVLPLLSGLLALMALLPICSCGMLQGGHDMPDHLMDAEDRKTGLAEIGWLICGIFVTAAWSSPLIMARHGILDMRVSWLACVGTWSLVGTIGLGLVFLKKGQNAGWSSSSYM